MTETVETLFDQAIERYKAGEGSKDLIPTFKENLRSRPQK